LLRTGGAPRPHVVSERAGQFDVDPARHGPPRYRLRACEHH
jgi:hypothetical protein